MIHKVVSSMNWGYRCCAKQWAQHWPWGKREPIMGENWAEVYTGTLRNPELFHCPRERITEFSMPACSGWSCSSSNPEAESGEILLGQTDCLESKSDFRYRIRLSERVPLYQAKERAFTTFLSCNVGQHWSIGQTSFPELPMKTSTPLPSLECFRWLLNTL